MHAKTSHGQPIELVPESLTALQKKVRGLLFMPGSDEFEASRALWNACIDNTPAFVVRCTGTADVIACVNFAREHELLLSIKGGGHNIAGLACANGAMMLDMSFMRGVWVDKDKRIAHAQSGCLLGDVDAETQLHGLAAVLGFVSLTGITGLTLGGGFGYLSKRWGWTADNVIGIDLITADGKQVRASADENPDLFWGLRGGGGNFGVVTAIDYVLHPVGPEIVGGPVAWPASEAAAVLELYRTMAEQAPAELTLVLMMRPAPPAPWLPEDMHGEPIIILLACYSGDVTEGEKAVAPIKAFGKPIGDILQRRPYTQLQSLLDATQPKGRRYYWKSEYLAEIAPGLCKQFIEQADNILSPHSALILFQLAGALNREDDDHSPAGNRDARYVLNIAGSWEHKEDDDANIGWAREAWGQMKAYSTGGTYINFLTEDEGLERTEAALGENLDRLARIKAQWDPQNLFRVNHNIKPAQ